MVDSDSGTRIVNQNYPETATRTHFLPSTFGTRENVRNSPFHWCVGESFMWGIASGTAMGFRQIRMKSSPMFAMNVALGTSILVCAPSYYFCHRRLKHNEEMIELMMKASDFQQEQEMSEPVPQQKHLFFGPSSSEKATQMEFVACQSPSSGNNNHGVSKYEFLQPISTQQALVESTKFEEEDGDTDAQSEDRERYSYDSETLKSIFTPRALMEDTANSKTQYPAPVSSIKRQAHLEELHFHTNFEHKNNNTQTHEHGKRTINDHHTNDLGDVEEENDSSRNKSRITLQVVINDEPNSNHIEDPTQKVRYLEKKSDDDKVQITLSPNDVIHYPTKTIATFYFDDIEQQAQWISSLNNIVCGLENLVKKDQQSKMMQESNLKDQSRTKHVTMGSVDYHRSTATLCEQNSEQNNISCMIGNTHDYICPKMPPGHTFKKEFCFEEKSNKHSDTKPTINNLFICCNSATTMCELDKQSRSTSCYEEKTHDDRRYGGNSQHSFKEENVTVSYRSHFDRNTFSEVSGSQITEQKQFMLLRESKSKFSLGKALLRTNKYKEAKAAFQKTLESRKILFGPNDPEVAEVYEALGDVAIGECDAKRAEEYFQQSLYIIKNYKRKLDSYIINNKIME